MKYWNIHTSLLNYLHVTSLSKGVRTTICKHYTLDARGSPCAWHTWQSPNLAHDKGFVVCCSRRRTHGKPSHDEPCFYSRPNCGHTAKLCRKSILTHGKKKVTDGLVFRVSPCRHTVMSQCLPCARVGHTANPLPRFGADKNEKIQSSFASLWPMGFKLMTSLSRISALNHCTTLWLVFILHFGSSNIIPNYV